MSAAEVEYLQIAIWQAAVRAIKIGVDFNRAGELLEAAMDEALCETLQAMDEATHYRIRRRLGRRGRSHRRLISLGLAQRKGDVMTNKGTAIGMKFPGKRECVLRAEISIHRQDGEHTLDITIMYPKRPEPPPPIEGALREFLEDRVRKLNGK